MTTPDPPVPDPGFDDATDSWLDIARDAESPEELGPLGRFEVIAEIGRGGQGVVYKARESGTDRVVALKVLLAGAAAGTEARRRLQREVEAASGLDHPGIVRIEGIEAAGGQPVLVMEWVDGLAATAWAEGREVRAIVEMAADAAGALGHAHARGVIHRDLKPSNLLVDGSGRPRILDFGLAKVLEAGGDAGTVLTRASGFLGTPAYAAPEQLEGAGAAGVRSDIWALGVVLYEMLTGRRPYDASRGIPRLLQALEREETPRPSALVPGLGRAMDAILQTALARDPARRYGSMEAFADDLRRWVRGDPLSVRPQGFRHQVARLVRRHRAASALSAALLVLLVAFAVTAAVQAGRLADERDQARQSAEEARAAELRTAEALRRTETGRARLSSVMTFLLGDIMAAASPVTPDGDVPVSRFLERATAAIDARFEGEPLIEAALRQAIGRVLMSAGRAREAVVQHLRARELLERELGKSHADVVAVIIDLARDEDALGDYAASEALAAEALEILEAGGPVKAEHEVLALAILARAHDARGRRGEARAAWRRALDRCGEHRETCRGLEAEVLSALAGSEFRAYENASCRRHFEAALAIHRELGGEDGYEAGLARCGYGQLLLADGELDRAEAELGKSLEDVARHLDRGSAAVLSIRGALALIPSRRGDHAAAEAAWRAIVAAERLVLDARHPQLIGSLRSHGTVLLALGRAEEARPLLAEALAAAREAFVAGDERLADLEATVAGLRPPPGEAGR